MDIIIDGAWHARWSLHSMDKITFFDDSLETDRLKYSRKLALTFASIMKNLEPVLTHESKVIYTLDYSSWRKRFSTKEGEKYKGNRVKDENEMNWAEWSKCVAEFGRLLESKFGVIFVYTYELEGDDSAYIWSSYLNKLGRECVLVASDGDWKQLINEKTHYLKKRGGANYGYDFVKIVTELTKNKPKKISRYTNHIIDTNSKSYKLLSANFSCIEANPYMFIFEKVVAGDGKDNIFPILTTPTQKDYKESQEHKRILYTAIKEDGLSYDESRNIADEIIRDNWIDGEVAKLINSYKKEKGKHPSTDIIEAWRVKITKTERKYRRSKPNLKIINAVLDNLDVSVENFDLLYDQNFIEKFCKALYLEMRAYQYMEMDDIYTNKDTYEKDKIRQIKENFSLNVKLLHLHKCNIPNDLIRKSLDRWIDSNKLIDHQTNVYDMFDENNIVKGATPSAMDLVHDSLQQNMSEDELFNW